MKLNELVTNVRSKNAGPFWVTIDVFCGSKNAYDTLNDLWCKAVVMIATCTERNTACCWQSWNCQNNTAANRALKIFQYY